MWPLIVALVGFGSVAPNAKQGLPVAPVDIEPGQQIVELRAPMYARSRGAHLVLYVRDRSNLGINDANLVEEFESAVPAGSITAYLSGPNAEPLVLRHSAYSYFRGYAGIVLTAESPDAAGDLYNQLELQSDVPLKNVRFVWLDRGGARVEDVQPSL